MLFTKSITTSLLLAGCALAQDAPGVKVHVVQVSSTEKAVLKFSPNNVQAKVGDMVQFQFHTGVSKTSIKPQIIPNTVSSRITL